MLQINVDVSIIIVNYNTKDLTLDCIRSIIEYTKGIKYEIIVVDNASSDESVNFIMDYYPNINIIKSENNIGFGRANNLGSKSAKGKYLFFLNSDCLLIENAIKNMFDYFESNNSNINRLGAVGCSLLDKNYNPNLSYNYFPTPANQIKSNIAGLLEKILKKNNFRMKGGANYKLNKDGEVEYINGADLFVPRNVFNQLNGFDSSFFMYYEETDLQKRMSEKSLKRVILSNVRILHFGGGSTPKKLSSKTIYIDSNLKYMRKHYSLVVYAIYYIIKLILFIPILFNCKHSRKDKKEFLKMVIRNGIPCLKVN